MIKMFPSSTLYASMTGNGYIYNRNGLFETIFPVLESLKHLDSCSVDYHENPSR